MLLTDENYRLNGYHKKKTNNSFGDRMIIEYYANYDSSTQTYSDLKVRETRAYTRQAGTGIMETITVDIEWLSGDGITPRATKQIVKYLDLDDGLKGNEKSRKRLLNKAKGAAIQLIGLSAGKAFMRSLATEVSMYKEGDYQMLIDGINASSQTQTFKDTLTTILNVSYIPV